MTADLQRELEAAIRAAKPLEEIVGLLRRYRERGVTQGEMYAVVEAIRDEAPDEAIEDRALEIADFVAGFCSPHMRVYDS